MEPMKTTELFVLFHGCSHWRINQDEDKHKHKKGKCFYFLFLRFCLLHACLHWDFRALVLVLVLIRISQVRENNDQFIIPARIVICGPIEWFFITRAERHQVEVSAPFFCVTFLKMQDQFDLALFKASRYSRVVNTSNTKSVGPGSIPGGRVWNLFSFFSDKAIILGCLLWS